MGQAGVCRAPSHADPGGAPLTIEGALRSLQQEVEVTQILRNPLKLIFGAEAQGLALGCGRV